MANSMLNIELNLKDTGYSKGVKSAQEALSKLAQENGVTNTTFRNLNREIGSAKSYYTNLSKAYGNLSAQAKQSEFGKAMHQQLKQTEKDLQDMMNATEKANKKLQEMQKIARDKANGGSSGSGFSMKQMGKDVMGRMGLGQLAEAGGFKAAAGIAGMTAGVGAAIAAYDGLSAAIKNNVETALEFEKSCSAIQALTGANVETMNKLKNAAIQLGGATTQSATEVMQAFGLIGSQAPQLLSDAQALAEVTKNVIMLSEASNIDLKDAAQGVTGILNQFGLSASKSQEIVNMLAAASQKGAGSVEYLNSAIVKCGSVAGALGVSTNQTVAVIEQLAQAGVDASSAGNQLKNIMLKLESSNDQNLKPSINGLVGALQNLAEKQMSSTEMSKMFGTENVAAALTLVKTANAADEMTQAITGTNTAEEQQRINNDNLQGSLKSLESKWEQFNLTLNQSNGLIRNFVDGCSNVVTWMTNLIPVTDNARLALRRFNEELGKGSKNEEGGVSNQVDEVSGKGTKGQKIGQYNTTVKHYKEGLKKIDKEIRETDDFLKKMADRWYGGDLGKAKTHFKAVSDKRDQLEGTKNELHSMMRQFQSEGYKAIYPAAKGIVETLQGDISSLTKKMNKATSKEEVAAFKKQIEEKKNALNDILGNNKTGGNKTGNAGGKSGGRGVVQETPSEKYANALSQIQAKEILMFYDNEDALNNEKKALEEKIKATEAYINELTKNEKEIKKNKNLVDTLNDTIKGYRNKLAKVKIVAQDEATVKKANEEYAKTLEKLGIERENGWITEAQYNDQYVKAIENLISKYKSVSNVTGDLKNAINAKQKEINNFEITSQFKKQFDNASLRTEGLIKDMFDIIGDEPEGNEYYKEVRNALDKIVLLTEKYYTLKASHESWNKTNSNDSKLEWIKNNKQAAISAGVPNFDVEAIARIKDVASASNEQIDILNRAVDVLNNTLGGINTNEFSEIYDTLKKTKDLASEIKSKKSFLGFDSTISQNEIDVLQDRYAVLTGKILEWAKTHSEAMKEVSDNAEIVDKLSSNPNLTKMSNEDMTEFNKLIKDLMIAYSQGQEWSKKWGEEFKEALKENQAVLKDYIKDVYTVDDAIKFVETQARNIKLQPQGNGDGSNFSLTGTSAYQVNKRAAINNHPDKRTLEEQQLNKLLDTYKKLEDKLIEIKELDDKLGTNTFTEYWEGEMENLEQDIYRLHDKIQDQLDFEVRVNGISDTVSNIESIGDSWSGLMDKWEQLAEGNESMSKPWEQFKLILDSLIMPLQTFQTIMSTLNTLDAAFAATQEVENAALEEQSQALTKVVVVTEAKAASDAQNTASSLEASAALKTQAAAAYDDAIASIFAAHASIPFAGTSIAAGMVGEMVAAAAAAKAALTFANGGIVDSGNFYGDSTLVRANKGEMILNTLEQRNLFNALKYGFESPMGGEVEFKLRGQELIGLMKNYNSKKSRL